MAKRYKQSRGWGHSLRDSKAAQRSETGGFPREGSRSAPGREGRERTVHTALQFPRPRHKNIPPLCVCSHTLSDPGTMSGTESNGRQHRWQWHWCHVRPAVNYSPQLLWPLSPWKHNMPGLTLSGQGDGRSGCSSGKVTAGCRLWGQSRHTPTPHPVSSPHIVPGRHDSVRTS